MTVGIMINLIFFAGMGVCALVRPAAVVSFVNFIPQNPDARNEVRAVYGGFGIFIAVLLWIAAYQAALRDGILLAVAGALLGMAFGRLVSFCIERSGGWTIFFMVMEASLAGVLLVGIDWSGVRI